MMIHDEEEEHQREACVPPEVTAGRYSRVHGNLTRTCSHTADSENGLNLHYEIRF